MASISSKVKEKSKFIRKEGEKIEKSRHRN